MLLRHVRTHSSVIARRVYKPTTDCCIKPERVGASFATFAWFIFLSWASASFVNCYVKFLR